LVITIASGVLEKKKLLQFLLLPAVFFISTSEGIRESKNGVMFLRL